MPPAHANADLLMGSVEAWCGPVEAGCGDVDRPGTRVGRGQVVTSRARGVTAGATAGVAGSDFRGVAAALRRCPAGGRAGTATIAPCRPRDHSCCRAALTNLSRVSPLPFFGSAGVEIEPRCRVAAIGWSCFGHRTVAFVPVHVGRMGLAYASRWIKMGDAVRRRKHAVAAASMITVGVLSVAGATAVATASESRGEETGPSSSQSPYLVGAQAGVVTKSILTVGDSVNLKPDGTPYRMVGIPDGLGAFDNGDGTFTVLMNHELPAAAGIVRAHGARGAFVSKWTIRSSDLTVLHGQDLIQALHTWNPTTSTWDVSNSDAAPARINRLCSADLAPVSAFYNAATGNGYNGRIFADGEEGGTAGRPFGHVVATGDSFELTPWLGNMSFENVVAHPDTHSDATVTIGLDDGDASVGQQVYFYRGTKTNTGNPVQKAGLANGKLYGIKVSGIPQSEYLKTDWQVGATFGVELVDVSAFAGVGGATDNGVVDTLDEDSQAKGVTNFQRPEDGAWDPNHPNDFYFVTTSSFGPAPAEQRTGQTRLWRVRFADVADPGKGGQLTLLVDGPIGTADNPPATGTQSAASPGPQMVDNVTVNDRGQVIMQEDVGNQAYLGGVWLYDIGSGRLVKVAQHDPNRFAVGAPGFLTKDEESSGVIPAPFLGAGWYLLDVQAHYPISGELVQGGQLLAMNIPPGKFK
jgi:hypothetical protein